jgi:hypothetical protein
MPRNSEDEYFGSGGPSNCCGSCGAGMHNNYRHDDNCLANLPVHTKKLIEWWHLGHDAKKSGSKPGLHMAVGSLEDTAYIMGYRCPQPEYVAA